MSIACCPAWEPELGLYLDDESDARMRRRVEEHVACCARCRRWVSWERALREETVAAFGAQRAPEGLRLRIERSLRAAPGARPLAASVLGAAPTDASRSWRSAFAYAAAACVCLAVGATLGAGPRGRMSRDCPQGAQATVPAPGRAEWPFGEELWEEVVDVHASALPADVGAVRAAEVAAHFQHEAGFRVLPARFAQPGSRLVGARLSRVRDRRAVALYYEVAGRRVTVVVFPTRRGAAERVGEGEGARGRVPYGQVRGYTLPVRHYAGLTYVFAGDMEGEELLRLAATASVP